MDSALIADFNWFSFLFKFRLTLNLFYHYVSGLYAPNFKNLSSITAHLTCMLFCTSLKYLIILWYTNCIKTEMYTPIFSYISWEEKLMMT